MDRKRIRRELQAIVDRSIPEHMKASIEARLDAMTTRDLQWLLDAMKRG
jgi:hypothetical protein